jgi:hypothetical protein
LSGYEHNKAKTGGHLTSASDATLRASKTLAAPLEAAETELDRLSTEQVARKVVSC